MIPVTLYTKPGCLLCEEVLENLMELQNVFPMSISIVNIEEEPGLKKEYGQEIPVVTIGSFKLKAPFSRQALEYALQAVSNLNLQGREYKAVDEVQAEASEQLPDKTVKKEVMWSKSDRFSYWLSRHYLAVINGLVIIFLGLPVLAPVFMKAGLTTPAALIYRMYSVTCHQLAFRSFFLFGEQFYYPREIASVKSLQSYNEATRLGEGNSPEEIWIARNFTGDEKIGYKIALCQRDLAIYAGILMFNFIFAISRRKIKPLNWILWIIIGLLPVGIDGISQLISQPPLSILTFRESTPVLRLLTGFLFGFTTAWFGTPHIEASMADTREMLEYKKSNKHPV